MCDFVSWIEKNGSLFYLTDAEIFSREGRKRLKGCKDNDVLGHGAIRQFFAISGGTDNENRYFWDSTGLPGEIAKKIKDFDAYWGKTFSQGNFMNDDLFFIIEEYAPDEWKAKAWEQLLKQKPSNSDLCNIIEDAPDEWKAKAWEQLLKQKPSDDYFHHINRYASDKWKAKAREQLEK